MKARALPISASTSPSRRWTFRHLLSRGLEMFPSFQRRIAFALIVFALVALVHLARFVLAWPVTVNGVQIPVWVSALAGVAAALLAVMLWRESTGRPR